jgi:predicted GNAT family N-acyltransferase
MQKVRFTIRKLNWAEAQTLAAPIRKAVFIREQNVPVELEWDGLDAEATHLIAFSAENEPVGTARILPNGHIGRMAVLKPWRHQGVSKMLMEALLELARARRIAKVFLNAQDHAVGFYKRYGFSAQGKAFMDAGIPHFYMERLLPPDN